MTLSTKYRSEKDSHTGDRYITIYNKDLATIQGEDAMHNSGIIIREMNAMDAKIRCLEAENKLLLGRIQKAGQ